MPEALLFIKQVAYYATGSDDHQWNKVIYRVLCPVSHICSNSLLREWQKLLCLVHIRMWVIHRNLACDISFQAKKGQVWTFSYCTILRVMLRMVSITLSSSKCKYVDEEEASIIMIHFQLQQLQVGLLMWFYTLVIYKLLMWSRKHSLNWFNSIKVTPG